MKYHLLLSFVSIVLVCNATLAQRTTKDNYTGSYTDASSWDTTPADDPLSVSVDIEIYGYQTYDGNMVWNDSKSGPDLFDFIVHDTLVITGNLTAFNNGHSLIIPSGGLVVIFGDFIANNKIDINNGGTLVILGDLTINNGGSSYTDGGGGLYVDGVIGGSNPTAPGDADAVDAPTTALDGTGDSGEQDLYDFISSGGTNPLPIKLASFAATQSNNAVSLQWSTLTEENFDYFEIQRAGEDGVFSVITTISGSGNSKTEIDYQWYDESPMIGINYYRLESVDFDGYREIFPTKLVVFESSNARVSVGPNPVTENGLLNFANTADQSVDFKIYNQMGHLQIEGTNPTMNEIKLPSNMKKGIYIISYKVNGLLKTEKLVVK